MIFGCRDWTVGLHETAARMVRRATTKSRDDCRNLFGIIGGIVYPKFSSFVSKRNHVTVEDPHKLKLTGSVSQFIEFDGSGFPVGVILV